MAKRKPVSKTNLGWMGRLLIAAGVVLLIVSGWFWWTKVFNSAPNVFNGMLQRSLSTRSVTRHIVQIGANGSGQDEVTQLNFGAQNFAYTKTTVTQKDQSGQAATVVTESIGSPTTDYARYLSIKTAQKSQSGKALDYSQIEKVWGKSDTASAQSTGGYFNQAILGIIPFGNLDAHERKALINKIRQDNVYKPDYSHLIVCYHRSVMGPA